LNDADSTELATGRKTQERDTPIGNAVNAICLRAGTALSRIRVYRLEFVFVTPSAGQFPQSPRDLVKSETEFGVMRLMGDPDGAWSLPAFEEFYSRHILYVWKVCADVGEQLSCSAWVEDVVQETFQRAQRTVGKFRFPTCPEEEEDNVVKAWLGRIAHNRLCDYWRKSRRERTGSDGQWEALTESVTVGDVPDATALGSNPANAKRLALIEEAMATLSEREAHVLRVTSQFHRHGKRFQRLPNSVVEELASSLNTTPENLRKIRERARRKVRQYVEERGG
jgi:RNA polymerase sigma factor (sigma-70 family)